MRWLGWLRQALIVDGQANLVFLLSFEATTFWERVEVKTERQSATHRTKPHP